MPFAFVAVEEDSPHCKVFTVSIIEVDVAGETVAYDWVTAGTMGILDQVPEVVLVHEITSPPTVCIGACDISGRVATRRAITLTKTSATIPLSNALHTYRITLLGKRAMEV